jgi:hypothetical protein
VEWHRNYQVKSSIRCNNWLDQLFVQIHLKKRKKKKKKMMMMMRD